MEETRGGWARQQRQHIRQHRWNLVSGSQRARSSGTVEEGRERREPHLNTLACMLALSRVFLIHRENACAFYLVFAPSRKTPRDARVFLCSSCASVIMCSHIGVPERSTEGDESAGPRGGPYLVYVRAGCADVCVRRAYMPTAVIRENK